MTDIILQRSCGGRQRLRWAALGRSLRVLCIEAVLVAGAPSGCSSAAPGATSALPQSTSPSTSPSTTSTNPPVPTSAAPSAPPYAVVATTIALVDRSRPTVSRGVTISSSRALTTVVWSPAVGTHWPLVVFAAGYRVGPDTYARLLQTWAAAGFVVAAPEFPLEDAAVAGSALDEGDLNNEPSDLRFVIASLVAANGRAAGEIDATRIAVAGHSDGAEVALAVAQDGYPSIKAAIIMAGQPVVPHRASNPPVLVIQGNLDTINPPGNSAAIYDQASGPRFLLNLIGAPHLAPFSGESKWRVIVDAVTTDFLDGYLAGDTSSAGQMMIDADHPGLSDLRALK